MSTVRLIWHDYRYFPYERVLAEREAAQLFGSRPIRDRGALVFPAGADFTESGIRLTYFKAVEAAEGQLIPDQARLEASANGKGQGWLPGMAPSLRRQSTRYSAHGLHEYRGKFNPQVVRAIGNLFGLAKDSWLFDPFCGSGTTLLEAAHIGWNCIGLDINPLGILIANAKVTAFTSCPGILSRECDALARRLNSRPTTDEAWRQRLAAPDYLMKWFREPVLQQIAVILREIEAVRPVNLQPVLRVVLSDIFRDVSLQDPTDLRIRRRKDPPENFPVLQIFLDSLRNKIASITKARVHIQPSKDRTQVAILGDSRDTYAAVRPVLSRWRGKAFDAAITSPPYATALPYMDTQRLSLALLGLLGPKEIRRSEKELIGNREILDNERVRLEGQLRANAANLPTKVSTFCTHVIKLADDPRHGFRKRNMPALIYKYLSDMAAMFSSLHPLMRPRAPFALLVGRNTTNLRDEEILIDTPALLAAVAESRGWSVAETLAFETYQRYDVHQENSIREEVLLILRRP